MTCIVGLKKDDKIYIGGDTLGSNLYSKTVRMDDKVFIKDDMIFGFTSSYRMGQILRYSFTAPERSVKVIDDMTYLVNDFIPALINCYSKFHWLTKEKDVASGGTFLLGYKKRLFAIYNDFQVAESIDDYCSCGCGEDFALGSMYSTEQSSLTPEDRITKAIEAATKFSCGVGGNIVIKNI